MNISAYIVSESLGFRNVYLFTEYVTAAGPHPELDQTSPHNQALLI